MLTLTHLRLALNDLFEKREPDLLLSKTGAFYAPTLAEQRAAIDALPPSLTGGTPLAVEIDDLDEIHDGFGAFIYFTSEAYLRLPGIDPAIAAAAQRIRAAFIPSLSELGASYAVEAERARDRRPRLETLKADLQLFPVADGKTLLDIAKAFLDAGDSLDQKLSERADKAQGSRKAASALRSGTVGILNRFRADLARELKRDAALPRDLEQRVFGYFDTLAAMRPAKPAKAAAPGKPASEGTPEASQ